MKRNIVIFGAFKIFLLLALVTSGCFPMGLPEYFSGSEESLLSGNGKTVIKRRHTHSSFLKTPKALLLIEDNLQIIPGGEAPNFLGNQYLLFVLPFTRVFYQHSEQTLLLEKVIDLLKRQGYSIFLARTQDLPLAEFYVEPNIIIKPSLENLSLNAYDFFFFRRLAIDGNLTLELKTPNAESFFYESLSLEATEFRKFGHVPELITFTEDIIRRALDDLWEKLTPLMYARKRIRQNQNFIPQKPPVIIQFPEFDETAFDSLESFSKLLASAYEYHSIPAFTSGAIARLTQRGLRAGLESLTIPVISHISTNRRHLHTHWSLETRIQKIETTEKEELHTTYFFTLLEEDRNGRHILHQAQCQQTLPLLENLDGALVVTLELATARAIKRFFDEHAQNIDSCTVEKR